MTISDLHLMDTPSAWVARFAPLVAERGRVLDVACGAGRHTKLFAERGHMVTAVDIDLTRLGPLRERPGVRAVQADIESGPWPFEGEQFSAVVVTNYLHRPLFKRLLAAVGPGGVLIYETFAAGNEHLGKPSNPDFLLQRGELLDVVRGRLTVIAFEDVTVDAPKPACVQRICAVCPVEGRIG